MLSAPFSVKRSRTVFLLWECDSEGMMWWAGLYLGKLAFTRKGRCSTSKCGAHTFSKGFYGFCSNNRLGFAECEEHLSFRFKWNFSSGKSFSVEQSRTVFFRLASWWGRRSKKRTSSSVCSDSGCVFEETVIGQRTVRELAIRHKDAVRERRP